MLDECESARSGVMKMNIKILGDCCSNCAKMEKVAREAIKDLRIEADVKKDSTSSRESYRVQKAGHEGHVSD